MFDFEENIKFKRTRDVKTGNLSVRESLFVLYEIVIDDAVMSDQEEWIWVNRILFVQLDEKNQKNESIRIRKRAV